MSYRDNLTEKFAMSLGCGFNKVAAPYVSEISSSDEMIKLAAGYTISDMSHDGIVKFVGDLFDRELQGLAEEKPEYTVNLRGISQSTLGYGVENATGEVVVFLPNNVNLEIPFAVSKGELIPFDVIQLNGERCPYTRENLGKVITNIIRQSKSSEDSSDGFVGLEARQNPTTTTGFLTNMLQVRSRGSVIPDAGGMFITASEKRFENLIDKIAEVKPFNWGQVEKVASIIADRDREKMIKHFSELGAESAEMVKTAATQSMMSKSQPWKKLAEIKHGTFVLIPEMQSSASKELKQPEFSMTPAYVIRNFDEDDFAAINSKDTYDRDILVVTADHRFMFTSKKSPIICLEAQKPLFTLKGRRLKTAEKNETILFKTGKGTYSVPFMVDHINVASVDGVYPNTTVTESADDIYGGLENRHPKTNKSQRYTAYNTGIKIKSLGLSSKLYSGGVIHNKGVDMDLSGRYRNIDLVVAPNVGKSIKKADKASAAFTLADAFKTSAEVIDFVLPKYRSLFYIADEEKKCIILSGTFGKVFTSYDELENIMSIPSEKTAGEDFCGFYKQASASDTVTVTKMSDTFNVTVRYAEDNDGSEVTREERLTGLSESAVMGALLGFGFDESIAKNMIIRATNSGSVSNNLPLGHNTKNIFGGKSKKIKKVIEKIKKNKWANLGTKIVVAKGLGKIISSAAEKVCDATSLSSNPTFIKVVMSKFASCAEEAKALSTEFEKKAVAQENESYRKIAKALAASYYFNDAASKVIENPSDYPYFDKVAAEVIKIKTDIEECISDLTMEKVASYKEGNFNINPSYYTRAVHSLNDMFETAKCFVDID